MPYHWGLHSNDLQTSYKLLAFILCCCFYSSLAQSTAETRRLFRISEDAPVGTEVGSLLDASRTPASSLTPSFIIVFPPEHNVESTFSINDITGQIKVSGLLDYEKKISYVFLAIPTNGSAGIRVEVQVVDVNDNRPAFPVTNFDAQISELAKLNSELPLPSAADTDSGDFAVQSYEIAAGNSNDTFRLSSQRLGSNLYPSLVLNRQLDRENTAAFALEIRALDGGQPPLSAILKVNVTVVDANDNAPSFERMHYVATLFENATIGTLVTRVHATDRDSGENAEIEYRLLPSQADAQRKFSIDKLQGIVTLGSPLSPAKTGSYHLLVAARDNGLQPLESTTIVTVNVLRSNVNLPQINVIFLSDNGQPSVPENAQIGAIIARISIGENQDSSQSAVLFSGTMLALRSDYEDGTFELISSEKSVYLLTLAQPLDRERRSSYELQLLVSGGSATVQQQPWTISRNFSLQVSDVNDNAPRFIAPVFEAEVKEKSIAGTSVLQLTVFDDDEGENARISYTLHAKLPEYAAWFNVDRETGLVSVAQEIDCGVSSRPEFTVIATDNGQPQPLSTSAKLALSVLDVNNSPPQFQQQFFRHSLSEDMAIGTCFLKVEATDTDCGLNGQLVYTFSEDVFVDSFSVDQKTGTVCVTRPLDYETRHSFYFYVIAQDRGGLRSEVLVNVEVEDANDSQPVFQPSVYNVTVLETVSVGTAVVVVSASDEDSEQFGNISYAFEFDDFGDSFSVDANTGVVSTRRQLPADTKYTLLIKATDRGNLASAKPAVVQISSLSKNSMAASFEKLVYRFRVREDILPDIEVGQVKAIAPGAVSYSIYDGNYNDQFAIDARNGKLKVTRALDHEQRSTVLLNIQASAGSQAVSGFTQVFIDIDDTNDNAPEFPISSLRLSLSEDHPPFVPFFTVRATDKDSSDNGLVKYRLLQNPNNSFIVNPTTGELSASRQLDFEQTKQVSLFLTAFDSGIPVRYANMSLQLVILNANDNPPLFSSDVYSVTISEDSAPLTRFLQLSATDADTENNGGISFSLLQSSNTSAANVHDDFGVLADNGWLYVRRQLDRERRNNYAITVVATDRGSKRLSSSVQVFINVEDVNDNVPQCPTQDALVFSVDENQPASVEIGVVAATDHDAGENATISYALLDDSWNNDFRIDSTTGRIAATKSFDAETQTQYQLSVVVKDNGQPQLSSTCAVLINIRDINDNAPYFILPQENRVFFKEEQPTGSEITQVRATDSDYQANGTVRYRILSAEPTTDAFNIDIRSGVITAKHVLDYETTPHLYQLSILAEDQGTPPLSSLKSLFIEVVDIDDDVSSLAQKDLNHLVVVFNVSELAPVGSSIGQVDSGRGDLSMFKTPENADISYSITSGNTLGIFDVDKLSSSLYLMKPLEFSVASAYSLQISRLNTSSAFAQRTTFAVRVFVRDENNHAPQFSDNDDPLMFSVPENVRTNAVLWQFNVSDLDSGSNSRIEYKIVAQLPAEAFTLEPVTGELRIMNQQPLDYENVTEYILIVEATDQAVDVSQRRSTRVTCRVYVTDVNDNRPQFTSADSAELTASQESIGSVVHELVAVDRDSFDNGRVSYKLLQGNDENWFVLNQETGGLSLSRQLVTTDPKSYSLTVQATDAGFPSLSTTQVLSISVKESSQERLLHFEHSIYHANVSENAPNATFVLRLTASDISGKSNQLVYSIAQSASSDLFRLNENTGILDVAGPLDRELSAQHVLTVLIRDNLNPGRYDVASVLVNVADVNDNAPKLSASSCGKLMIPENEQLDKLHRILATDADAGENSSLTYFIRGGNVDGKFMLDEASSQLSCKPLNREAIAFYNLTIVVRDNGNPVLSDECFLTISVADTNDNAPTFEQSNYVIEVAETTAPGTGILTVKAMDKDEGLNSRISYSLSNDSIGMFEIDPRTGAIKTIGQLDYENRQVVSFMVIAADQGPTESLSSSAKVTVKVLDSNDNAPVFSNCPITVSFAAEVAAGQRIAKLSATDDDGPGANSELFYSFNESYADFNVNPTTGVVSAKTELQLSQDTVRLLTVIATDKGQPPLSSACVIELSAAVENHGSQQSASNHTLRVKLKESAKRGSRVVDLKSKLALQQQQIDGSNLQFLINSGNEQGAFAIEKSLGVLTVADASKIDFKTQQTHQLIVSVLQNNVTRKSSQRVSSDQRSNIFVTVFVDVEDENDHAPQFLQQHYHATVHEGRPRATFIVQVSAIDEDSGENAAITYSIVGGNLDSAFNINSLGTIQTNAELDREINDHYSLTVMATDGGVPVQSGSTTIEIQVLDVNDNRPQFPPSRLIRLSEGFEVGKPITFVTANDVDTAPPLTYRFTSNGNPSGTFSLDMFSGGLSLAKPLDFETQKSFLLSIEASDQIHTALTKQKIEVLDENDNAPQFTHQFYQAEIPENTPVGASIIRVSATDKDTGDNARLSFAIEGFSRRTFWIHPQTGDLFLNESISLLGSQSYSTELVVVASDHGKMPKSTTALVHVHLVQAATEPQPKFTRDEYRFHISEEAAINSIVGRVQLIADKDLKQQQSVYKIVTGNERQLFQLDSVGNLLLISQLDREIESQYMLKVVVHSKSNSVSNSSATILVIVLDVNDNSPRFEQQEQLEVTVSELAVPGTQIAKLTATDADAGVNAEVSYAITSGNEQNEFRVDASTGAVTVQSALDFEFRQQYKLVIRASDNALQNRKSSLASLVVNVLDENDNTPRFAVSHYLDSIPENAPVATLILIAKATDMDKSDYGRISYSINKAAYADRFAIEPASGTLRTVGTFDFEQQTLYKFDIVASDGGGRNSMVPVSILVKGVDEFSPEFELSQYEFQVSFESEIGDIVGTVHATDKDAGIDGEVHYSFKDSNSFFRIHETTGTIFVDGDLQQLKLNSNAGNSGALNSGDLGMTKRALSTASFPGTNEETTSVRENSDSHIVLLAVVARSGSEFTFGKTNTTTVEIRLSHFQRKQTFVGTLSSTTTGVISVLGIILLLLMTIFVGVKLRRWKQHKSPAFLKRDLRQNMILKRADIRISSTVGSSSNNTGSYRPGYLFSVSDVVKNSEISGPRRPSVDSIYEHQLPRPAFQQESITTTSLTKSLPGRTQQMPSVSGRSSGRGSLVGDETEAEADEEIRRINCIQSQASYRSHQLRSVPDSGVHVFPDDSMSVASDLANAQEYLTQLGVALTPSTSRMRIESQGRCSHYNGENTVSQGDTSKNCFSDLSSTEETEDVDINTLIYAKLDEVCTDDAFSSDHTVKDLRSLSQIPQPCRRRIRSSIADDSVFSPNISVQQQDLSQTTPPVFWSDASKQWSGPYFQPLTQVFSEIARLKHEQQGAVVGSPVPPPQQQPQTTQGPLQSIRTDEPATSSKTQLPPVAPKRPTLPCIGDRTQATAFNSTCQTSPDLVFLPNFASPNSPKHLLCNNYASLENSSTSSRHKAEERTEKNCSKRESQCSTLPRTELEMKI